MDVGLRCVVVKAAASCIMDGFVTGLCLPTPNDGVDVEWIDLKAAAAPANALRGHDGAAATHKRIQNEIAAGGAVEDSVGHEFDGLHRWVQRQQFAFLGTASE